MIERTTVRLPKELLDRARRKAAADGVTLTALIEDGLRQVVSRKRQREKPTGAIPVSKATLSSPMSHTCFIVVKTPS